MADAAEEVDAGVQARGRLRLVRAGQGSRRPNPAELAVMRMLPARPVQNLPRLRERLDRQLELPFDELDRSRRRQFDGSEWSR